MSFLNFGFETVEFVSNLGIGAWGFREAVCGEIGCAGPDRLIDVGD